MRKDSAGRNSDVAFVDCDQRRCEGWELTLSERRVMSQKVGDVGESAADTSALALHIGSHGCRRRCGKQEEVALATSPTGAENAWRPGARMTGNAKQKGSRLREWRGAL